jgi:tRNA-specific 2-thiouridylase
MEVRRLAEEHGFVNAGKAESQDICFVPDGDYAAFIRSHTGKAYPAGPFVDREGRVLGTHRGIVHYTVGQRHGLGIAAEAPLYVAAIRPETNEVVLGRREALFSAGLNADGFNWIAFGEPPGVLRARARIRYRAPEVWADITVTGPGAVHLDFDEPQRAVTPGQAVVLYDGDTVLGGGTIE